MGTSPRWRYRTIVRWLFAAALIVALGVALRQRWVEVRSGLSQLSAGGLGLSVIAAAAAVGAVFASWRTLLADLGHPLPLRAAYRIFFLGQLGKYLPGSLWPILAQGELGRDYDVPRARSTAALVLMQLVVVATGLAIFVAGAPLLAVESVRAYSWVVAVLPLLLALLHPAVMNRLLSLGMRLLRRPLVAVHISGAAIARAAGWGVLAWTAYGVHTWALAADLGADSVSGATLLVRATAAFAGAWCVGFLLILVPAGAGVREVALVLLLGSSLPVSQAGVLALISRLVLTVTDAATGALAVPRMRGAGGSAPPAPTSRRNRAATTPETQRPVDASALRPEELSRAPRRRG